MDSTNSINGSPGLVIEANDLGGTIHGKTIVKSLNEVTLPYIIKDHVLFSPGEWKGHIYNDRTISDAFYDTNWDFLTNSLFWEHDDLDGRAWVGEVRNVKLIDEHLVGDIYVVDQPLAIKLAFGAKFGVSPRLSGKAGSDGVVRNANFDNFSIVLNPACKTTFLNSAIETTTEKNEGEIPKMTDELKNSTDLRKDEIERLTSIISNLSKEISEIKGKTGELYADKQKDLDKVKQKELDEKMAAELADREQKELAQTEMMKLLKSINNKIAIDTPAEPKEAEKSEPEGTAPADATPAEADVDSKDGEEKEITEKMSGEDGEAPKEEEEITAKMSEEPEKPEDDVLIEKKEEGEKSNLPQNESVDALNEYLSVKPITRFDNAPIAEDVGMANYLRNAFEIK